MALILNFILFLSLPFLNKVREGEITLIKRYPVSLYRFEVKRQKLTTLPKAKPRQDEVERLREPEPLKKEISKGEKNQPEISAPIEETQGVLAYEGDLLSREELISSHIEGESKAEEIVEEPSIVYDISELDRPLRLLKYELPAYPLLAQKRGIEATLVLRLLINEMGLVERIELLESNVGDEFGFLDEAKKVIKDWRFSKPMIKGKGVSVFYVFPLRFVPR